MKTTFAESLHFTNFTLAWTRTSERGAQSIFQSHTQIFKERSSQKTRNQYSLRIFISKLSNGEAVYGGAKRDRTADLLRARQALSQLSYGPITKLVGLGRFELPTSPLSGVRSNQLSYRPNFELVTVSSELSAWSLKLLLSSSSMNQAIRVGAHAAADVVD